MKRSVLAWVWFIAVTVWAVPARAGDPFTLTLENDTATISGVTPHGQVALFGVTREIGEDDFHTVRTYLQTLTDDDGDGSVLFTFPEALPTRSLFAAADLANGAYATAPEKFELNLVAWQERGIARLQEGTDAIGDQRTLVDLVVVRPGVGAWSQRVSDGDPGDADGLTNGQLEGVLDQMKPVGESPASPSIFEPNDLLFAIDPNAMVMTLTQAPAAP